MDEIMNHILNGDFKKEILSNGGFRFGKVTGIHSTLYKTDKIRITKIPGSEKSGGFYEAKIEVFDEDLYEIQKNSSSIDDINKGWKKKKTNSSMFPDYWSEEEIKKAIVEAYDNNGRGIITRIDDRNKPHKIGYTKDGIPIEFYLDNYPNSAFPNFNLE